MKALIETASPWRISLTRQASPVFTAQIKNKTFTETATLQRLKYTSDLQVQDNNIKI